MKRRTLVSCSVWLLPLLLVRLLVPAGYMLDASTGELRIVVCAGAAAPHLNATQEAGGAHHDHAHHQQHSAGHHGGAAGDAEPSAWHGDVSCPFAQLASLLPTVDVAAKLAQTATQQIVGRQDAVHLILHSDQHEPIRGPPVFS